MVTSKNEGKSEITGVFQCLHNMLFLEQEKIHELESDLVV